MDSTTTLYRPTGIHELELIAVSGCQSIFYPVLNEEYTTQIARDWNAKNSESGVGIVTKFSVKCPD